MANQVTIDDIDRLKVWLDTEITILHIMFAVMLGVIVGGKIWWFVGLYIFISTIYMFRRIAIMPKDYLKVKRSLR